MNRLMILSFSFIMATASIAFSNSTLNQHRYNSCITEIIKTDRLFDFIKLSPEKQANACLDILKKSQPDIVEKINFEEFKKGFYDGSYRRDH